MKAYAITWYIGSYDGDKILSVWLDKSEARQELIRLRQNQFYTNDVGLKEVKLNDPNGFENVLEI